MESKIRTCDACGNIIPDKFYKIEITARTMGDVYDGTMIYADLCKDCFGLTIEALKNRKTKNDQDYTR